MSGKVNKKNRIFFFYFSLLLFRILTRSRLVAHSLYEINRFYNSIILELLCCFNSGTWHATYLLILVQYNSLKNCKFFRNKFFHDPITKIFSFNGYPRLRNTVDIDQYQIKIFNITDILFRLCVDCLDTWFFQ